jgi:hypothetical protein
MADWDTGGLVLIHDHRQFTDPGNARLVKRLRKHRDHLLRFLYVDELDATNNQGEVQLRPAMITCKTQVCVAWDAHVCHVSESVPVRRRTSLW